MKKRGRPRSSSNAQISRHDEEIASAVHQLVFWGFPVRRVCDVVAQCARDVLGRTDHTGRLPLSGDRVEQLYERWRTSLPEPDQLFAISRTSYKKSSLERRRPDKTRRIEELATVLLRHGGEWQEAPGEPYIVWGDPELTPAAAIRYMRNRLTIKTG